MGFMAFRFSAIARPKNFATCFASMAVPGVIFYSFLIV